MKEYFIERKTLIQPHLSVSLHKNVADVSSISYVQIFIQSEQLGSRGAEKDFYLFTDKWQQEDTHFSNPEVNVRKKCRRNLRLR